MLACVYDTCTMDQHERIRVQRLRSQSRREGGDMDPTHPADVVVIVNYDPDWPRLFAEERVRLEPTIAAIATSIEHVGSTAVSGLCAKPLIDLLVTVERLDPPDRYVPMLAAFGYRLLSDPANPARHSFGKRDALGRRPVPGYNVHIMQLGSAAHRGVIGFRDYLRAHPDVARAYGDLKRRLARAYGADWDGYTDAKGPFIRSLEANWL